MQECTKCGLNKSLDQYQTYWHSTQNTFRTRRYCKDCFRKQKQEYKEKKKLEENPTLFYENNPEYSQCKQCSNWKHKTEYYLINKKINLYMCKECCTNKEREERQQYLKENCGSDFVHANPNKYTDIYQKECIFDVLKILGYLYNEEFGIWTKPGVKELGDGEPIFLKLKPKIKKEKKKRIRGITTQHIKSVLELRSQGVRVMDIVEQVEISENSVYKIIKTYSNAKSS